MREKEADNGEKIFKDFNNFINMKIKTLFKTIFCAGLVLNMRARQLSFLKIFETFSPNMDILSLFILSNFSFNSLECSKSLCVTAVDTTL